MKICKECGGLFGEGADQSKCVCKKPTEDTGDYIKDMFNDLGIGVKTLDASYFLWAAKDSTQLLGKYTICFFLKEPTLDKNGFWRGDRYPINLNLDLKPGEKKEIKIEFVDEAKTI